LRSSADTPSDNLSACSEKLILLEESAPYV